MYILQYIYMRSVFHFKLDWGSYILSITKSAYKKIGDLICSLRFLSCEVLPHSRKKLPCNLA